jgi:large subunit ribosomal protein L1
VARIGKRMVAAQGLLEEGQKYTLEQSFELLPKTCTAKFDESVDVAVRLGVDPKQADQMVRGAVSLPNGVGKSVRVVVFAEGDAARAATEAGADFVGGNELIDKILAESWTDFDKAVATRGMMARVGRLGRVLGPRGLMPNPRSGSVCGDDEVGRVVREVKGGRVDFKVDKTGIIHAAIGKASMTPEQVRENLVAFLQVLLRMKPSTAKGIYVRSVTVSGTMGPGVRIEPNELVRVAGELR